MSQRLHIGKTEEIFYDYVITSDSEDLVERLESEWLFLINGAFLGPIKIHIGDLPLYRKVHNKIKYVVEKHFRESYPEKIWAFYRYGESIEHPTTDELEKFLKG